MLDADRLPECVLDHVVVAVCDPLLEVDCDVDSELEELGDVVVVLLTVLE